MNAYDTAVEEGVDKAKIKAATHGCNYYVFKIDGGGEFDDDQIRVYDDTYINTDEFDAFDGEVIYTVTPDGSVE